MIVNLIGGQEVGLPIEHQEVLCVDIGDNNIGVELFMFYDQEKDMFYKKERPYTPEPQLTPAEQREQAYTSLTHKADGTPLIVWGSQPMTVDQANQRWLDYFAEGNTKANELSGLIVSAKSYIRDLYPNIQ